MITPDKIYTDNPFVDNVLYYAKILAMNCVVKDEDEAIKNEFKDSLNAGSALILSAEGRSSYEVFDNIFRDVLEKYIPKKSNLDMFIESKDSFDFYLSTLGEVEREDLKDNLSSLCRTTYIDHYNLMHDHLSKLSPTWLEDNLNLYNAALNRTATYVDLYDVLPTETKLMILKQYLSSYNISAINGMAEDINKLREYMDTRIGDATLDTELNSISSAMCSVFVSHYDTLKSRDYLNPDKRYWLQFQGLEDTYDKCKNGTAGYFELYYLFPVQELHNALSTVLSEDIINQFQLDTDIELLNDYVNHLDNPRGVFHNISKELIKRYLYNYNIYINDSIYEQCESATIEYEELFKILPEETIKSILKSHIGEFTNIDTYSEDKRALNRYLAGLEFDKAEEIRNGIAKDMKELYPKRYTEYNNYYRSLIGLAPINPDTKKEYLDTLERTYCSKSDEYVIFGQKYISMIPEDALGDPAKWTQPIDSLDAYDISVLEEAGILEMYKDECKRRNPKDISLRYEYFKFLGDAKLDAYTCRKASQFQLMSVPTVDDADARKKFIDAYNINREYIMKSFYADNYKYQSEYFDKFMIIFIIINTMMDMLTGIPELMINRELFDARCIRAIFESYGIPYFEDIPIKYQRAMLKNLNILIKYKSSTRNMVDICSLFGFKDVRVFNYYLFKSKNTDSKGNYIFKDTAALSYNPEDLYLRTDNGNLTDYNGLKYTKLTEVPAYEDRYFKKIKVLNEDTGNITEQTKMDEKINFYVKDPKDPENFVRIKDMEYFKQIKAATEPSDLKFIKVPITDGITEYKNDNNYISDYEDVVSQDEGDTWDGGLQHDYLKRQILDYEFNAVRSKYISIETVQDMSEMAFQVTYFFNMLFDNLYSEDNLTVSIPTLKAGHKFRLLDVVCYLFAMTYFYNGLKDNIMYSPTQILHVKGYSFNDSFNTVLNNDKYFTQIDPKDGEALKPEDKTNIFDINTRIVEDKYKYQDAFKDYKMKAFNLEANVDELDKWAIENFQISLKDLIVDDSLSKFNEVITVRHFFSLNNSYYQKDILNDNLLPMQYNQNIKYAYSFKHIRKKYIYDIEENRHEFIELNGGNIEVINNKSNKIYVLDYDQYILYDGKKRAVYYLYNRSVNGYDKSSTVPYYYDRINNKMESVFDGEEYIIRDSNLKCVLASTMFYRKHNGAYEPIKDAKYFTLDKYNCKVLNFLEYYEQKPDGTWKLREDNCWVRMTKGGVKRWVLKKDSGNKLIIPETEMFVKRKNGKFVRLSETDHYSPGNWGQYEFKEEDCFIISDIPTEYYDSDATPRVYYQSLKEFYTTNEVFVSSESYVRDPAGNYIPESELVHPSNCYYFFNKTYILVTAKLATYLNNASYNCRGLAVLQSNNEYSILLSSNDNYIPSVQPQTRYVYNSDLRFITRFNLRDTYAETRELIVMLNRKPDGTSIDTSNNNATWDENDWFYRDNTYTAEVVGMMGEHKWTYKKPSSKTGTNNTGNIISKSEDSIGCGFYIDADSYLGSSELESGSKYFMSFDVEVNFNGNIQIYNEADGSVKTRLDKSYRTLPGVKFHVNHIFTANDIKHPSIRFVLYNSEENPVEPGMMISISNLKFTKSHSDNFISQDIPSFQKLQDLYRTNTAIYKYLTTKMIEESNYDKHQLYKVLYESLMTAKYNKEIFKNKDGTYAKTYTDFLATRDSILHEKLTGLMSMDKEIMMKEIADAIIEATYSIDASMDSVEFKHLYSYLPAVSSKFVQQYLMKVINFFKSWKVHLLGINTIYKMDDPFENTVQILDDQDMHIRTLIASNVHVADVVKINPEYREDGERYDTLFPDWELFNLRLSDNCRPVDRVRVMSISQNKITYTDNYEEMHISFDDDSIKALESPSGDFIIRSGTDGFKAADNFLFIDDKDSNAIYPAQSISGVNINSTDILEEEYRNEQE